MNTEVIAAVAETAPSWMIYFTVAVGCLLAISEALSVIPSVKSNGIFQAIGNILKAISGKDE